jgi:hypothetical protein
VAFFIYFGSLGATLVSFEHLEAILQTNGNLEGFFIFFPTKKIMRIIIFS